MKYRNEGSVEMAWERRSKFWGEEMKVEYLDTILGAAGVLDSLKGTLTLTRIDRRDRRKGLGFVENSKYSSGIQINTVQV